MSSTSALSCTSLYCLALYCVVLYGSAEPCLILRPFLRLQARLQQALMQWQHPSAPLPPAMLAAAQPGSSTAAAPAAAAAGDRSKGNPAALLLRERAQQWREALRGAYVALRHGHCPVIYVCGQVGVVRHD
jgi:hypothetical protein